MTQEGNGKVIWLYGRPCSGKTTLSSALAEVLKIEDKPVIILDGDELRFGINSDLGYSLTDRHENIRRVSEIAKILAGQGYWVLCSFVTPTRELRELVRQINRESDLIMINIQASLEVCIRRDVKGHYLKAKMHNLTEFTGISSPFEEPLEFENTINTDKISIGEATQKCMDLIMNQVNIN